MKLHPTLATSTMSDSYERVTSELQRHGFCSAWSGAPSRARWTSVTSEKVAYLHLDMNCTAPEIAALEYFWPKIAPFGIVVMDDYGWPRHHQQKIGYDRFVRERGLQLLQLPTGQAILIKPPA